MRLYLDSSAFVKLWIDEQHEEIVRAAADTASSRATSLITFPETRSGFARLFREDWLNGEEHQKLVTLLDGAWPLWHRLYITPTIAQTAGKLVAKHALRGADGIHLASALHLRRRAGGRWVFGCFDKRLVAAAKAEDFELLV